MHLPKAVLFSIMFCLPVAHAVDDTVTIVDGTSASIGAFASKGTNNFLMITNGGSASLSSIATSGRSNVVIVTGAGSTIANNSALTFGSGIGSSSNALAFLNGGSMNHALTVAGTNNFIHIDTSTNILTGLSFGGRSNILQLDNGAIQATTCQVNSLFGNYLMSNSSKWSDNSVDSSQGQTNFFLISGGSVRASGSWSLASPGDTLQVTDPGSIWRVTNFVSIGTQSSGLSHNEAQIIAGGHADLRANVELGSSSPFNRLVLDGVGSDVRIAGALNIGFNGNSNAVVVTGGGRLHTGSASIGSTANSITVSGDGSSWDNTNTFTFNSSAVGQLAALDGGTMSLASMSSGNNLLTIDAFSHITISNAVTVGTQLSVTGGGLLKSGSATGGTAIDISGGSTWTVVTNLSLNDAGSGHTLLISEGSTLNGARLSFTSSSIDPALTNLVDVTGPGSSLNMTSIVAGSRGQRIFVANGGRLSSGDFTSARENTTVEVSGANSTIQIVGNLFTTNSFTNNIFRVTSGGVLMNGSASIGVGPDASISEAAALSSVSVDGAGSRWITATNLVIGQHANSNAFFISNGGAAIVSNLTVGFFQPAPPFGVSVNRSGAKNAFYVDGAMSRLDASGNIQVGYNSLSNRFTITGGATVTARNFNSGILSNSQGTFFVRSNVVQVIGPNSTLTISSNASFTGGSYLILSNSATLSAGGIAALADHTAIVADSQLHADQAVQIYASEIFVENSRITTPTLLLGWFFDTAHMSVTGARSSLQCDAVHVAKTDAQGRDLNGTAILDLLDSATVTSRWFTIGLNSPTNAPAVNVDGGYLNIGASDLSGLLEIERGTLTLHRGNIAADSALLHGSDATVNIDGGLYISGDIAAQDGNLRIASTLTLDQGGNVHVAGPVAFSHSAKLQLILGDISGWSNIVAAGAATLGGQLTVSIAPPNQAAAGMVIPILSAASVTGKFENVAAGERILTTDRSGTFLLNVTATDVTLSDFAPIETRLTATLNASGSAIVLTFPAALNAAVQTSTNLTEWINITNPQTQTASGQTEATLPIDAGEAQRFYRLVR